MGTGLARGGRDKAAFAQTAERYRRKGDADKAVEVCQAGLAAFPEHLSGRVTLGWALLDLGRYDEARAELEQVLRRAPDNLAAIRGLAELHDRSESSLLEMEMPEGWQSDHRPSPPAEPAAHVPADTVTAVEDADADAAIAALVDTGPLEVDPVVPELVTTTQAAMGGADSAPATIEDGDRSLIDAPADHDLATALAGLEHELDVPGARHGAEELEAVPERAQAEASPALAATTETAEGSGHAVEPTAEDEARQATLEAERTAAEAAALEAAELVQQAVGESNTSEVAALAFADFEDVPPRDADDRADLEAMTASVGAGDRPDPLPGELPVAAPGASAEAVPLASVPEDLADAVAAFEEAESEAHSQQAALEAAASMTSAAPPSLPAEDTGDSGLENAAALVEARAEVSDLAEDIAAFAAVTDRSAVPAAPDVPGESQAAEVAFADDVPLADLDSPFLEAGDASDLEAVAAALHAPDEAAADQPEPDLISLSPEPGSDASVFAQFESALPDESDDADFATGHGSGPSGRDHDGELEGAYAAAERAGDDARGLADEIAAFSAVDEVDVPGDGRDGADAGAMAAAMSQPQAGADWTPPALDSSPAAAEANDEEPRPAPGTPAFGRTEAADAVVVALSASRSAAPVEARADAFGRAEPDEAVAATRRRIVRLETLLRRVRARRLRIAAESVA